jgi:hypothetical protein
VPPLYAFFPCMSGGCPVGCGHACAGCDAGHCATTDWLVQHSPAFSKVYCEHPCCWNSNESCAGDYQATKEWLTAHSPLYNKVAGQQP